MRRMMLKSAALFGMFVFFLSSSLLTFGITLDDPLLKEIDFNKTDSILSGTTAPAANVSLSEVVIEVVADEEGHFELPVPAGLDKSQIRVNDYIEDQSTTIEFDFKLGEIAKVEEQAENPTNKLATDVTNTAAITNQTVPNTINSEVAAEPEQTVPTISPWLYAIIALVLFFVGLLLYFLKLQKEGKKQTKITKETKNKSKKKRRRKKKSRRHH